MATISITPSALDPVVTSNATTTRRRAGQPTTAPRAEPEADRRVPGDELQREDLEDLRGLADELQAALDRAAPEPIDVNFKQDNRADGYVVEIRAENGDLIRQFPPEKVLNMRNRLAELTGMVVDEMT